MQEYGKRYRCEAIPLSRNNALFVVTTDVVDQIVTKQIRETSVFPYTGVEYEKFSYWGGYDVPRWRKFVQNQMTLYKGRHIDNLYLFSCRGGKLSGYDINGFLEIDPRESELFTTYYSDTKLRVLIAYLFEELVGQNFSDMPESTKRLVEFYIEYNERRRLLID